MVTRFMGPDGEYYIGIPDSSKEILDKYSNFLDVLNIPTPDGNIAVHVIAEQELAEALKMLRKARSAQTFQDGWGGM